MPLITRINSLSKDNNMLQIKNEAGEVLATITPTNSCELAVETIDTLHVEKPNGFSSKKE